MHLKSHTFTTKVFIARQREQLLEQEPKSHFFSLREPPTHTIINFCEDHLKNTRKLPVYLFSEFIPSESENSNNEDRQTISKYLNNPELALYERGTAAKHRTYGECAPPPPPLYNINYRPRNTGAVTFLARHGQRPREC